MSAHHILGLEQVPRVRLFADYCQGQISSSPLNERLQLNVLSPVIANGIPSFYVAIPTPATPLVTWRPNRSLPRLRFGTAKKSRNAIGSAKKLRRSNSSPRR